MTTAIDETDLVQLFHYDEPFLLEGGGVLPSLTLAYQTWGRLAPDGGNVVWICHALTGDSAATTWWQDIVGIGKVIDPERHFIVCANMVGSCYGSTGPTTIDALTGQPLYANFPLVTIRDMVRAQILLRRHLGINRLAVLIGGSMGGQQVLEWAVQEPDHIGTIVPIATNARHSPWAIAFNAAQRMAIEADPTYAEARADGGRAGLAAARAIGMLSYRTATLYNGRQRDDEERLQGFRAESYQQYQGAKLVDRFSAHAYHVLSRAMDSHDIGRGRGGTGAALRSIRAATLVIGIDSDLLFPEEEQHFIADMIPHAAYRRLRSNAGHDAFLLDQHQLATILHAHRILE